METLDQRAPAQIILRRLQKFPQIEKVYLFGSRARGDAGPRSDIDLAIACPGADAIVWSDICEAADTSDTLLTLDIIRLEEAPSELLEKILTEGCLLYERH